MHQAHGIIEDRLEQETWIGRSSRQSDRIRFSAPVAVAARSSCGGRASVRSVVSLLRSQSRSISDDTEKQGKILMGPLPGTSWGATGGDGQKGEGGGTLAH